LPADIATAVTLLGVSGADVLAVKKLKTASTSAFS
jgi:hypothetical protein